MLLLYIFLYSNVLPPDIQLVPCGMPHEYRRSSIMKKTNIHKLTFAAVLTALAVVGSLISFPIGASKCAPVQHLVNIIGAVFLGPAWSVGIAFAASLLRNLLGLGTLMAFPGSMVGALLAGLLYKYIKVLPVAYIGELFGTSVLGGLLAFPIAKYIMGSNEAALFGYIMPFFVSCAGGTILAIFIVTALKKAKVFDGFLGIAKPAGESKA